MTPTQYRALATKTKLITEVAQRKKEEDKLHCEVADWCRANLLKSVLWYHIPNGGKRHIGVALLLKKFGLLPGAPDLEFLHEGMTHYLELKTAKGSTSKVQNLFRDRALAAGAVYEVAKNLSDAKEIISCWCLVKPNAHVISARRAA